MPDGRSVSRRTFVVGSLGSALAAGCGGGNSSTDSPTSGRGAAQFTILWPEVKPDSRLIPAAAKSITIKLVGPVTVTKTVARPPVGTNQTTVNFPDLDSGTYTATATAYPNADGTGTAQATGTVNVTIVKNQTATSSLTMGTTITKVEVAPASFAVAKGGTTTLTAMAYDASNAIVLTGSTWSWSSSDTGKAIVSGTTTSAIVTGVASGSTTITATESESGKFGSSAGSVGFNQGEGLADSSWPRSGANQWNTYFTPVAGNTSGTVQWSVANIAGEPVIDSQGYIYLTSTNKILKISPLGSTSTFYTGVKNAIFTLTIDKSGNIYAGQEEKLYKLDNSGNIIWTYTSPHTGSVFTFNNSINIHKNNTVFTNLSFLDFTIGKSPKTFSLLPNGTVQWIKDSGNFITVSETRLATAAGPILWFNLDGTSISGTFPASGYRLAEAMNGIYYCTYDTKTVAIDSNLSKKWEINSGGIYLAVTPDNKIIIDGSRCYNSSGSLLWTAKEGANSLSGSMALSSTTMYVASGSIANGLYAINLTDGSILWKKSISFAASNLPQPVLGSDGTVYISHDGTLTAYR
nr:Ig-like domain-containing protein [Armatimonas sp.]